ARSPPTVEPAMPPSMPLPLPPGPKASDKVLLVLPSRPPISALSCATSRGEVFRHVDHDALTSHRVDRDVIPARGDPKRLLAIETLHLQCPDLLGHGPGTGEAHLVQFRGLSLQFPLG